MRNTSKNLSEKVCNNPVHELNEFYYKTVLPMYLEALEKAAQENETLMKNRSRDAVFYTTLGAAIATALSMVVYSL